MDERTAIVTRDANGFALALEANIVDRTRVTQCRRGGADKGLHARRRRPRGARV